MAERRNSTVIGIESDTVHVYIGRGFGGSEEGKGGRGRSGGGGR